MSCGIVRWLGVASVDEGDCGRASPGSVVLDVGPSIVPMRPIAPALSLQQHGEGAKEPVGDAVKSSLASCKAAVDRATPAPSESSRGQVLATPGGAAAYESAPRADPAARRSAGSQLSRNWRIQVTARYATQLRTGEVDSCLLVTHAALSSQYRLRVTAFGDASSGARVLFREVTITTGSSGGEAAGLTADLAMVRAQHRPYPPVRHDRPPGHRQGRAGHRARRVKPAGALAAVLLVHPQPASAHMTVIAGASPLE
jgi:hypothetical protein